jgi:phosphoserine phosphatase RsbX
MGQKVGTSPIEWGVAASTLLGEKETGDQHVVAETPCGILLAAIDGLGHGEEAAVAARIAAAVLEEFPQESVIPLVQRCHEKLRSTRGVVMSLATIDSLENTVTWLGVGNVEGLLLHRDSYGTLIREALILRGGVVGDRLPNLFAGMYPLSRGDTIIFTTDGIRKEFVEGLPLRESPQEIANFILVRYARESDDALAVVARYRGRGKQNNGV